MPTVLSRKPGGGGGGGAPSGAAGGDLSGTYPDPALSVAKQAEIDGKVPKSLYDAQTVLAATTDDTPAAITMGASTTLARLAAGNIVAASASQMRTMLDVPSNAEAILDTIADAKGDIIAATAADTVARLAVGADGTVLTAASGQASGLQWATPSGGRTLIQSIVAGAGGVASLDFTSIPGTYTHLELRVMLQTENAAAQEVGVRFNNDSGANYDSEHYYAIDGNGFAAKTTGQTSAHCAIAAETGETMPMYASIEIPFYALTAYQKQILTKGGWLTGTSRAWDSWVGYWHNTAAITRVTFIELTGSDFKQGATAYLYGLT